LSLILPGCDLIPLFSKDKRNKVFFFAIESHSTLFFKQKGEIKKFRLTERQSLKNNILSVKL
jgi:hypothetical protein